MSTENLEANQTQFNLYPNPTYNELNIELSADIFVENIVITDRSGRVVMLVPFSNTISLTNLPAGLYFVRLEGAEETFEVKKVVVLR